MFLSISERLILFRSWNGSQDLAPDLGIVDIEEDASEIDCTYFIWTMNSICPGFGEAIIFIKYNSSDIGSLTSIGGGKSCSYRNWYTIKGRYSSMR